MCDREYSQSDFDQGTIRIQTPGKHCIKENIIFKPNPGSHLHPNAPGAWFPNNNNQFPGSTNQLQGGQFVLGFLTAISVEGDNVIIDLQGFEIKSSIDFCIQQRFFSIIELAQVHHGSANFNPNGVKIQNITIQNGILGLSSHYGIHSNSAKDIKMKNLIIKDFEVGGIHLNKFDHATISNVTIGPSSTDVRVTGLYSNARFALLALRALRTHFISNPPIPSITFNGGRTVSFKEIGGNLIEAMDLVFRVLIGDLTETSVINGVRVSDNPNYIAGKRLFVNTNKLPDGSTLYGIIANSDDHDGSLNIDDVRIHGLKMSVNEVPAVYFNKCLEKDDDITIQKGPFADVLDLRLAVNDTDAALIDNHSVDGNSLNDIQYIGNPLIDAQIAIAEFATGNLRFGTHIDTHLINWAKGESSFPSSCADFVCNGDIMFHTNQGITGLKVEGSYDGDVATQVRIRDLQIDDLDNQSPLVSNACGNYSGPHDGGNPRQLHLEGGMGTDCKGINLLNVDVAMMDESRIANLNSSYGDTIGFNVGEGTIVDFEAGSDMIIKDLTSASDLSEGQYDLLVEHGKSPYPNNFGVCTIKNDGKIIEDIADGKDQSYCTKGSKGYVYVDRHPVFEVNGTGNPAGFAIMCVLIACIVGYLRGIVS